MTSMCLSQKSIFGNPIKSLFQSVKKYRKSAMTIGLGVVSLFLAFTASALTAPAADDFAYQIYDIAVNDMLNGPIGFVAGVAAIAGGGFLLMKSIFLGVMTIAIPVIM